MADSRLPTGHREAAQANFVRWKRFVAAFTELEFREGFASTAARSGPNGTAPSSNIRIAGVRGTSAIRKNYRLRPSS
jgi:hypothetical protein